MTTYQFTRCTRNGSHLDGQVRNLPDDDAAVTWMVREFLNQDEHLKAYRQGEAEPFARRDFGEDVEVLG